MNDGDNKYDKNKINEHNIGRSEYQYYIIFLNTCN